MKRLLPVLLAGLMLLSCSNPLMDGQNSHVNVFIYPYLEFTEEENEVAVSVVEGADVSFISIPSEIMINGEAKPVTAFTGFQNPEDAEKLTALYIPAAVTIKDGALSNSPNLAKIEKTDVTESSVWTGLPGNLSRPGYHFIGWYAGDDKVENGSAISPDYPAAEPKFEAHSLNPVQEIEPTCTEKGTKAYYECSICKEKFSDSDGLVSISDDELVIAPLGHDESGEWQHDNEKHWQICSTCEEKINEGLHKFGDYIEAGNDTWICSCEICGYEYSVEHYEHSFPLEHHPYKVATCTEKGNYEYWECSICHEKFKDAGATVTIEEIIIPELGHDYPKNPTATDYEKDDDNHWLECSRCHKHFNEETHKYEVVYDFNSKTGALIAISECEICGFEKKASSSSSTGAFDITTTFGVSAERLETNKWRISLDETYKDMFSGYVWTDSNGNEICEEIQGKDSFEIEVTETVGEDLMLMCHLYDDSGTEMEICFVTITR